MSTAILQKPQTKERWADRCQHRPHNSACRTAIDLMLLWRLASHELTGSVTQCY